MIKNIRMIPRGFIHPNFNLFTIEGFFMSKIQLPVIDTKTALLTAGVMLGMSAGMMINHNVHADTVNSNMPVMTANNSNNNENSVPSQVKSVQSATTNTTQLIQTENETDTVSATDNTSDDQVVTENHAMTATTNDDQQQTHKINFNFTFPDGSKVPLETYSNVANDISQYNNVKTGTKYDLSDWKLSAFPEFDFVGLKDANTGKTIPYMGTMPDHDLNVQLVIQPTGDGQLKSTDIKDMDPVMKACHDYIQKHGLPSHLDHQAYGGKTEDEFNNMADGTKDKDNQGTHEGKDPNRDIINNQKHVTLKFNVLYNGKVYGTETIKDAIVGNPYTLTSISSLQSKLQEKGLTLNSASLKLLSGTVPDKDTTYNLQVVKADNTSTNADNDDDTVRDTTKSVPDSKISDGESGGQTSWQSSDGTEAPTSDSTSANKSSDTQADSDNQDGNNQNVQNSDPNKQQNTKSSDQSNANNQQLPQTGNVQNTVALVALGLSCMGIGTALLLKRE